MVEKIINLVSKYNNYFNLTFKSVNILIYSLQNYVYLNSFNALSICLRYFLTIEIINLLAVNFVI